MDLRVLPRISGQFLARQDRLAAQLAEDEGSVDDSDVRDVLISDSRVRVAQFLVLSQGITDSLAELTLNRAYYAQPRVSVFTS